MTTTSNEVDVLDDNGWDGPEPTAAELEQWHRDVLATGDKIEPDLFPRLHNLSAGYMYRAVIRPEQPQRPEYVTIPVQPGMGEAETSVAISRWNMLWEAAQFRRRFFDEDELPAPLAKIADQGDVRISLVPRSTSRYFEYAVLYHLLPRATLERFGLPLLHGGQWRPGPGRRRRPVPSGRLPRPAHPRLGVRRLALPGARLPTERVHPR